jgi:alcohol dehydrogenase
MQLKPEPFNFILPTKVEFGPGAIDLLPEELVRNELGKAVLVVTPGRNRSGMLDGPIEALQSRNIEVAVYAGVRENPDLDSVADCVAFLQHHRPDVLVGFGGGSSLDTTKAAGICYANDIDDVRDLSALSRKRKVLPVIMVPTTAGSGSEVNYWSVISDKGTKEKLSIGDPAMSPLLALVDPQLCISLPERATLYTGLDALTHAVESFFSITSNWLSDMLALGAVSLIVSSLEQAVVEGGDLQARSNMSLASMLAGMSMENVGLGLIHALSHQVSGYHDTPHGLANALLLPHVLAFNGSVCRKKMKSLAALVRGRHDFSRWLKKLYSSFGVQANLVTIYEADIPAMAIKALENVNARTNPAQAEVNDIENILRKSFAVSIQSS